MESKVISVFYDNLCYPFKDSARSVRYPVTGNTFAGTNKTTEIRFYVDRMGGTNGISWVVVSKLPNGKLGYELLSSVGNDSDLNEQYLSFSVSSYYTQYQGVVKLALRGYSGEITFHEDPLNPGVYNIVGDPLIDVTGTIDLAINYSPFVNTGTTILPTDLDQILAWLADYLNIANGIVSYTPSVSFDLSQYEIGQVFYNKTYRYFEQKTGDNTLTTINLSNHAKLVGNNTFDGNNTFLGNNTYSGTNTFTGNAIFNGGFYVDNIYLGRGSFGYQEEYDRFVLQNENGTTFTFEDDGVFYEGEELALRSYVDNKFDALGNVLEYKGTKSVSELNTLSSGLTSANTGDTYNVSDSGTLSAGSVVVQAGDNVAWDGTEWDKLSSTVDLSGYVQKTTTIAGIDLQDNITASELTDALVYATNSDVDALFE